jgi:hypothetical protein
MQEGQSQPTEWEKHPECLSVQVQGHEWWERHPEHLSEPEEFPLQRFDADGECALQLNDESWDEEIQSGLFR